MNNEGFRQLINQSSKRKTTKEIAREAVEEEFNERKRKGGGRNLADGYSSNEEDDRPNPKWKRQQEGKDDAADDDNKRSNQREKKKKAKKDEGAKYRDRAKERREGKNVDYELSAGIQSTTSQIESMFTDQSKSSEEMSKYLGGDEAHTHLVKGLDKALADKVRREEMGRHTSSQNDATKNNQTKNNIDLDDVIENFHSKKRNHQQSFLKQSDSTAKSRFNLSTNFQHRLRHPSLPVCSDHTSSDILSNSAAIKKINLYTDLLVAESGKERHHHSVAITSTLTERLFFWEPRLASYYGALCSAS